MGILGNRSRDGLMAEMLYALLDQPSGSREGTAFPRIDIDE